MGTRRRSSAPCSRSPARASTGCCGWRFPPRAALIDRRRRALYLRTLRLVVVAYLTNIALEVRGAPQASATGGPAAAVVDGDQPLLSIRALDHLVRRGPGALRARFRPRPYTPAPARWRSRASTWACTTPPTWPPGCCSGRRCRSSSREDRDRRAAQRRQVVALQRPHPRGGGGGQLPIHDCGAKRGRGARARRPARPRGRDDRRHAHGVRDDRVPRHRRAGARGPRRRGAGQPLPRQHPRDGRPGARGARPRRPPGRASRGTGRPADGRRHGRDRASLRGPRAGGATAGEGQPRGQVGRGGEGGRGALAGGAGGARSAKAAPRAQCRRPMPPRRRCASLGPLTAKPVLYLANVGEGESQSPPDSLREHAARVGRAGGGGVGADRGRAVRARGRRGRGHARRPGRRRVGPGAR